jgi:hypothetical protein
MDRSVGTAASTGGTGNLGGSFLTVGNGCSFTGSGQMLWIQAGTYTISSGITLPGTTFQMEGYQTTHGDLGTPPVISTSSGITMFTQGNQYTQPVIFTNISFASTASSGSSAWTNTTWSNVTCNWCVFNFASGNNAVYLVNGAITAIFFACEFKGTGNGIVSNGGSYPSLVMHSCYFHNTGYGVWDNNSGNGAQASPVAINCVFSGCSRGIYYQNTGNSWPVALMVANCAFYNCTNEGINMPRNVNSYESMSSSTVIINSIFYGNGTYGVYTNNSFGPTEYLGYLSFCNAYGSNTSGNYHDWITSFGDVALTANPFTSSSNFTLNATAGGGPLCKGTGFPGITPVGTGGASTGPLAPSSGVSGIIRPIPFNIGSE